jgi:hypothetical protein
MVTFFDSIRIMSLSELIYHQPPQTKHLSSMSAHLESICQIFQLTLSHLRFSNHPIFPTNHTPANLLSLQAFSQGEIIDLVRNHHCWTTAGGEMAQWDHDINTKIPKLYGEMSI